MNEEEFNAVIVRCIATVICVLIVTLGGCTAYETHVFAANGYIERTLPGMAGKAWAKPEISEP